jgi:hypothetical protein
MASRIKEIRKEKRKRRRELFIRNLVADIKGLPTTLDFKISNAKTAVNRYRVKRRVAQIERNRAKREAEERARAYAPDDVDDYDDDYEDDFDDDYEEYTPKSRARSSGKRTRPASPRSGTGMVVAKKAAAVMSQVIRNAAANMVSEGGATRSMGFWDEGRAPWEVHPESYQPKRQAAPRRSPSKSRGYDFDGGFGDFDGMAMPSKPKRKPARSSSFADMSRSPWDSSSGRGSTRGGYGSSMRKSGDDFINGYQLSISRDGTVGSAYKGGRHYIPYHKVKRGEKIYWMPCINRYQPAEIRQLTARKVFKWVSEEQHMNRGY